MITLSLISNGSPINKKVSSVLLLSYYYIYYKKLRIIRTGNSILFLFFPSYATIIYITSSITIVTLLQKYRVKNLVKNYIIAIF